jgi:flagellar basal-body rod protein FlgB
MPNSLFTDNSLGAANAALDGLSLRQQAISRNLANVDTPGYHAQSVDFEGALQRAYNKTKSQTVKLETTSSGHMAATTAKTGYQVSNRPGGSERADQNNVDIDVELTDLSQTGIQYQALSEAVTRKFSLLQYIAK